MGTCKIFVYESQEDEDSGNQALHLVSLGTDLCDDICCSKPTHGWNSAVISSIFLPAGIKIPESETLKLDWTTSYSSVLILCQNLQKLSIPFTGKVLQ